MDKINVGTGTEPYKIYAVLDKIIFYLFKKNTRHHQRKKGSVIVNKLDCLDYDGTFFSGDYDRYE